MIFYENVEKTPTVKVYTVEIMPPIIVMKPRLPLCLLCFNCVPIHVARISMAFWSFVYALPQNVKEFEAARMPLIKGSPKFGLLKHESTFLAVSFIL